MTFPGRDDAHIGRSFRGHPLEDECPCPQQPCGLVRFGDVNPACEQHPIRRTRTMRQIHSAATCPALGGEAS